MSTNPVYRAVPAAPVRSGGIGLGRLAGAPVRLQPSALIFAGLVALAYGPALSATGDRSATTGYLVALTFVVLLFASVLLHECGHAVVARRCGVGVRGITLELLGGYTELDRPAPRPGVDVAVAAAGPLVSLLLGVAALLVTAVLPDGSLAALLVAQLAVSNLIVAVFNSLPGLPLDGGRVLAGGLWWLTGDRSRGILVAGWVGRGVALATAVATVLLFQLGYRQVFGIAFALLLVMTLWQGAGHAIRAAGAARAGDLSAYATPLAPVPAGTPLAEAQRQLAASARPDAVLAVVDPADQIVAVVDEVAAAAVPPERRHLVDVGTVARALTSVPALPASTTGAQLRHAVAAHPAPLYLVTSGEDVYGALRAADLPTLFARLA